MKKTIICGAQPNGFWPISKLISIVSWLRWKSFFEFYWYWISYDIALKNKDLFSKVIYSENYYLDTISASQDKIAIIVMNHDLAFQCFKNHIPYIFIDSLFWFWFSKQDDVSLFSSFEQDLKRYQSEYDDSFYDKYNIHEKKLLIHYLSSKSYVQNFIGIENRICTYKNVLKKEIYITKPIIYKDIKQINKINITIKDTPLCVINLWWVKNFLHTWTKKNDYVDLIKKLSLDIWSRSNIKHIKVYSWFYKQKHSVKYKSWEISLLYGNNRDFLFDMIQADTYITSPWLTNFFEILTLKKKTIFFLEQHMSQYYNMRNIKKTFLWNFCISIHDIIWNSYIPPEDFEGSIEINNIIRKILNDKCLYKKLLQLLIKKKEALERYPIVDFHKWIETILSTLQNNTVNIFDSLLIDIKNLK